MIAKTAAGDGILQSEDRTPNLRGALLNGLITELPNADASHLAEQIESGEVKTLVVVNEDLTTLGVSASVLSKAKIIYFGMHANETSKVADVVCPSLSVFEKEGSFVNVSFRVQKFAAAVPGPKGIYSDVVVLEKISAALAGEKPEAVNHDIIWERLSTKVTEFAALNWRGIGAEGAAVDASAFVKLPFPESKNLKFDPVAFKEAHAAPAGA